MLRGLVKDIIFPRTNPQSQGDFLKKIVPEQKKFYLTKKGLERIKEEYKNLKILKLFKTQGEIPKAWHSEDLNPEYLSFQEDLGLLESRLAELEGILKNAEVIKLPSKEKQNIVNLGATVLVETDGERDEFEIVGTLEANPSLRRISNESPVGKAILGRRVGDIVTVQSPAPIVYKILKIKYKQTSLI